MLYFNRFESYCIKKTDFWEIFYITETLSTVHPFLDASYGDSKYLTSVLINHRPVALQETSESASSPLLTAWVPFFFFFKKSHFESYFLGYRFVFGASRGLSNKKNQKKKNPPDDDIHNETVSHQADHKHHRIHSRDDGDDGRHALLLPAALIVGHVAAVRVTGHPSWWIPRTALQQRE